MVDIYLAQELGDQAVLQYLELERIQSGRERSLPNATEEMTHAFERDGMNGLLARLAAKYSGPLSNDYDLARTYARLGDEERALEWLTHAHDTRNFNFVFILAEPAFEAFHKSMDPRFRDLKDSLMH